MTISTLFDQAELSLAAYATLQPGSTSAQLIALQQGTSGLSPKQAEEFAEKHPDVLTQFNDIVTSLSATIFKDTAGHLTLAIRGTAELAGVPGDLYPTDKDIWLESKGPGSN